MKKIILFNDKADCCGCAACVRQKISSACRCSGRSGGGRRLWTPVSTCMAESGRAPIWACTLVSTQNYKPSTLPSLQRVAALTVEQDAQYAGHRW